MSNTIDTSVQHKRSIIAAEVQNVLEYSQAITDPHILDNAVANIRKFSSALKQGSVENVTKW